MEAISISVFVSQFSETVSVHHALHSSIRTVNKPTGFPKLNLCLPNKSPWSCGYRLLAISREASHEGEEERPLDNNDFGLVSEENASLFQGNSQYDQISKKGANETPLTITYGNGTRGGTRAGLFRTPVSGGVQNATSAHGLPRPALAVRDLMEQGNSQYDQISEKGVNETTSTVTYGSGTGGGTRTGLFRTPISGGVQNATLAHGLPRPALAVRNLMEQARFAHLCTVMSRMHHRREGYPFGSLVDFAPDSMGHPIFSFSPLAIHTRNLLADPRCTLVVQIPGWSGLSNARVTIFGDVFPLPDHQQEWAHKQYIGKHHQGPSQQWGNFYYSRMQNISDIYFIGGFGTVAWVDVKEYQSLQPDKIAVDGGEQNLKELNSIFSKPLKELLFTELEVDDAALISIDSKGTDVRVRQGAQFNIQRLSFEEGGNTVETLDEAKEALWKIIDRG